MARRKNSAEMLDVLRRITQEEKARRLKQLQKSSAPLQPAAEIFRVVAKKPDAGGGPGDSDVLDAAAAAAQAGTSRALFAGPPLKAESPAENPIATEHLANRIAPPNRLSRSFLSVLSGGRTRVPAPTDAPAMAASLAQLASQPVASQRSTAEEGTDQDGAPQNGPVEQAVGPQGSIQPAAVAVGLEGPSARAARLAGASPDSIPEPDEGPPDRGRSEDAFRHGDERAASGFADARKPLFSVPADEGSLRGFWVRCTNVLVGEGMARGIKETLESRIGSIALYVAVALAALLVVILYTNNSGDENPEGEKLLQSTARADPASGDAGSPASAPQSPIALELIPGGQNLPPEVRNIESAESERSPKPSPKANQPHPPGAAPQGDAQANLRVWKGDTGPRGHYIQVQSAVLAEHTDPIVAYLGELGYRSIWVRPMRKIEAIETYIIRLGPFETERAAKEEMQNYLQLTKNKPFRSKPRINLRDPYVLLYQPR